MHIFHFFRPPISSDWNRQRPKRTSGETKRQVQHRKLRTRNCIHPNEMKKEGKTNTKSSEDIKPETRLLSNANGPRRPRIIFRTRRTEIKTREEPIHSLIFDRFCVYLASDPSITWPARRGPPCRRASLQKKKRKEDNSSSFQVRTLGFLSVKQICH